MNILQVCSFFASYEGNFLKSLYSLDKALEEKGHKTCYAFPQKAFEMQWCRELQKRTKVFALPFKSSRLNTKAVSELKRIIKDEHIDIVHSHFEFYDIACKKAAGKDTKVFWHLHDPIVKARRPYKNWIVKLQYSHYGKGVTLISVCDYYKDIAVSLGFSKDDAKTILNGIDLDRIKYPYPNGTREYDFLTFGWDFYRKGVDVILNVMKRLASEGYRFKFLLNCKENTKPLINNQLGGETPDWLVIGDPVEDVNTLFCNSNTFIQGSVRETFCYAACEAAYAGLDIISSDIEGLEWAHSLPSVTFFESKNEEQLYSLLKQRLDEKFQIPLSAIKKSREIIEKEYSTDKWVSEIIKQYLA